MLVAQFPTPPHAPQFPHDPRAPSSSERKKVQRWFITKDDPSPKNDPSSGRNTKCSKRTHGPKSVHAAQKFPTSQIFTAELHVGHAKVSPTSLKSLTSLRVAGDTPRDIPISNDAAEKKQVCCSDVSHTPTFSFSDPRAQLSNFSEKSTTMVRSRRTVRLPGGNQSSGRHTDSN